MTESPLYQLNESIDKVVENISKLFPEKLEINNIDITP